MEKILIKNKEIAITVAQVLGVTGVILLAQLFNNQLITGVIINTLLICSCYFLGIKKTIGIAIIPSLFAFSLGILPALLGPFIPFIITSNIILISCIYLLKNKYILGMILGAFLKFGFLFFSSSVLFNQIFNFNFPSQVLYTMSYPQLFTALLGGIISYLILSKFKKI